MARRKKDAGLCGSGALRRRARSKKGAGEDAPARGTTSKEDEDCTAQPKESAELWSSGAPLKVLCRKGPSTSVITRTLARRDGGIQDVGWLIHVGRA